MHLVVDGQHVPLVEKHTFAEGRAIEKVTGMTYNEAREAAQKGSMLAMQSLYWVSIKRVQPTRSFASLDDVEIESIDVDFDTDAERVHVARLRRKAGQELSGADAALVAAADEADAEAAAGQAPGGQQAGALEVVATPA